MIFELSFDDFYKFWNKNCYYCGNEISTIGLDRIDNKIGYTNENTISCCTVCNYMKYTHDVIFFLSHVKRIIAFNKAPYYNSHNNKPRTTKYFSATFAQAKTKKLEFNLDKEFFTNLIYKTCVYCGSSKKIGIDRIDSDKGYVYDNVCSCCKICNHMKKDLSTDKFLNHIKSIHDYME